MSYYHGSIADPAFGWIGRRPERRSEMAGFGGFGCGADCRCSACRSGPTFSSFGERYVDDDDDDDDNGSPNGEEREPPSSSTPPPPEPVTSSTSSGRRRRRGARRRGLGGGPYFGEPPAPSTVPLFRLDCSLGCLPFPPVMCRSILQQAILDACRLAANAARKLSAFMRDSKTVQEFMTIFGHDPGRPEPWPGIKDAGIRIAIRYQLVEKALLRANTLYRCDPCTQTVYERPEGFVLDLHARALPPNEVRLCPSFWHLSPILQAGVILHEMFHLRFDPCFVHGACETKRTSAYCYEIFALRMANKTPDPLAVSKCSASTLRP